MATHPDLAAEQAHIDRAYEQLERMREAARRMISSVISQGRGGTHQAREERDVIVRSSLARLERLNIGRESLCFGRIDRAAGGPGGAAGVGAAGGADALESFHIGRLAVSGPDHEPLVVDWRAPVAEPFYRATGAHPMGLVRRRHFLTEGRTLLALEEEVFGDGSGGDAAIGGILLSSLDRARTGHMRDIVATIQSEQDQIIRAPLAGLMIVQGGPGTGKTAVALHRAAYLLYTHRFPLERQGVLVVGPNQVFLRYIEQVLPSLGESGVALTTLGGLVAEVQVRATDPPELAALKGQERMARLIRRAVRDRQRPLPQGLEVGLGPYILRLSAQDTAAVVAAGRRRHGTHNARRRHVEAELFRLLHQRYLEAVESAPAAEEAGARAVEEAPPEPGLAPIVPLFPEPEEEPLEGAGPLDEAELRARLRHQPDVVRALDRMWPRLSAEELVHDLFGARPLLSLAARGVLTAAEAELLHRPRSAALEDIPWTAADLALIDEAKVLLGPVHRGGGPGEADDGPRAYGHIVVDEAQDFSPMQLRMLARRSISGSMTVVGDVAQATGAEAPSGWEEVARHLSPRRPPTVVELSVNYRTPAEIMDVAGRVLEAAAPGLTPPRSVRETGVRPVAVAVPGGESLPSALAGVAADELAAVTPGNVVVICPDSWAQRLAEPLEAALARRGVHLGLPERDGLERPVTLVPAGLAKGLEFDSVLVVEPAAVVEEAAQGLRALYVALTRATRRLTVVHTRDLPGVLSDLESATTAS
ncbi:MAG TPA: ATP-binding domain-containing protein [Acidimicrobiales bacterium]|nr:ATP-binding domain-containing protein [Acidimicrobiales bacterium]